MPNIFQPQPLSASDLAPLASSVPGYPANVDPALVDRAFASSKAIGDSFGAALAPFSPKNRLADEIGQRSSILQQNALKKLPAGSDSMDLEAIQNYARLKGAPKYTPDGMYDVEGMRNELASIADESMKATRLAMLARTRGTGGLSVPIVETAKMVRAFSDAGVAIPQVLDAITGEPRDPTGAELYQLMGQPGNEQVFSHYVSAGGAATGSGTGTGASGGARASQASGADELKLSASATQNIINSNVSTQQVSKLVDDMLPVIDEFGGIELGLGGLADQWNARFGEGEAKAAATANIAKSARAASKFDIGIMNLGFIVPKILDPGSVAREGEQRVVKSIIPLNKFTDPRMLLSPDQGKEIAKQSLLEVKAQMEDRYNLFQAALAPGGKQYELGRYYTIDLPNGKTGVGIADVQNGRVVLHPLTKTAISQIDPSTVIDANSVPVVPQRGIRPGPIGATPVPSSPAPATAAPVSVPAAASGGAKVGDVHTFSDGSTKELAPDGSWVPVDAAKARKAKAAALLGTPVASAAAPAPAPAALPAPAAAPAPLANVQLTNAQRLNANLLGAAPATNNLTLPLQGQRVTSTRGGQTSGMFGGFGKAGPLSKMTAWDKK